jgi:hypothetical protein
VRREEAAHSKQNGTNKRRPACRRGAASVVSGQSRDYASRRRWLVVSAQMMMTSSAITMIDQIG